MSRPPIRGRYWPPPAWLCVLVFALVVRLAYLESNGITRTPDTEHYVRLAHNLVEHGSFSLYDEPPFPATTRRPPLYPVYLALFHGAGDDTGIAAVLVQCALSSIVALGILWISKTYTSSTAAAIAAMTYAVHPGVFPQVSTLLSESIATFFLLAGLVALVSGITRDRPARTLAAGVLFGIAVLGRSMLAPLLTVTVLSAVGFTKSARKALLHGSVGVIALLIVVGPWVVRCTRAAGQLVFVQASGGAMLYIPTRYDWNQGDERFVWSHFANLELGRSLDGLTLPPEMAKGDRKLVQEAFARIRAEPWKYLASRVRYVPYFVVNSFDSFTGLNVSFQQALREQRYGSVVLKGVLLLTFSVLPLVLAIVGLRDARREVAACSCTVVWVGTILLYLPLWIEYRYFTPAIPALLVGAAGGIDKLIGLANRPTDGAGISGGAERPS